MAAWVMLVTAWTVGVPFYLRFLVALCGELRRVKICRLVRLQTTPRELPLVELKQEKKLRARAA
jgi:hypothetical protein